MKEKSVLDIFIQEMVDEHEKRVAKAINRDNLVIFGIFCLMVIINCL